MVSALRISCTLQLLDWNQAHRQVVLGLGHRQVLPFRIIVLAQLNLMRSDEMIHKTAKDNFRKVHSNAFMRSASKWMEKKRMLFVFAAFKARGIKLLRISPPTGYHVIVSNCVHQQSVSRNFHARQFAAIDSAAWKQRHRGMQALSFIEDHAK